MPTNPEPTRIIAIRHGETAWNVDARIQGRIDIPLNATGHWQAARLGSALAARDAIHAIYSSDLLRAQATAHAVSQATGTLLTLHEGLRERDFGRFEGQTFPEIERAWPEDARRWRERDPLWAPPGGETLSLMRVRIEGTLNELGERHAGQQIVLVAHGGVMDMLYRLATGQALQAPRSWLLSNAAVNRLLWTPQGLSLVGWADISHLQEGEHGSVRDETTA